MLVDLASENTKKMLICMRRWNKLKPVSENWTHIHVLASNFKFTLSTTTLLEWFEFSTKKCSHDLFLYSCQLLLLVMFTSYFFDSETCIDDEFYHSNMFLLFFSVFSDVEIAVFQ